MPITNSPTIGFGSCPRTPTSKCDTSPYGTPKSKCFPTSPAHASSRKLPGLTESLKHGAKYLRKSVSASKHFLLDNREEDGGSQGGTRPLPIWRSLPHRKSSSSRTLYQAWETDSGVFMFDDPKTTSTCKTHDGSKYKALQLLNKRESLGDMFYDTLSGRSPALESPQLNKRKSFSDLFRRPSAHSASTSRPKRSKLSKRRSFYSDNSRLNPPNFDRKEEVGHAISKDAPQHLSRPPSDSSNSNSKSVNKLDGSIVRPNNKSLRFFNHPPVIEAVSEVSSYDKSQASEEGCRNITPNSYLNLLIEGAIPSSESRNSIREHSSTPSPCRAQPMIATDFLADVDSPLTRNFKLHFDDHRYPEFERQKTPNNELEPGQVCEITQSTDLKDIDPGFRRRHKGSEIKGEDCPKLVEQSTCSRDIETGNNDELVRIHIAQVVAKMTEHYHSSSDKIFVEITRVGKAILDEQSTNQKIRTILSLEDMQQQLSFLGKILEESIELRTPEGPAYRRLPPLTPESYLGQDEHELHIMEKQCSKQVRRDLMAPAYVPKSKGSAEKAQSYNPSTYARATLYDRYQKAKHKCQLWNAEDQLHEAHLRYVGGQDEIKSEKWGFKVGSHLSLHKDYSMPLSIAATDVFAVPDFVSLPVATQGAKNKACELRGSSYDKGTDVLKYSRGQTGFFEDQVSTPAPRDEESRLKDFPCSGMLSTWSSLMDMSENIAVDGSRSPSGHWSNKRTSRSSSNCSQPTYVHIEDILLERNLQQVLADNEFSRCHSFDASNPKVLYTSDIFAERVSSTLSEAQVNIGHKRDNQHSKEDPCSSDANGDHDSKLPNTLSLTDLGLCKCGKRTEVAKSDKVLRYPEEGRLKWPNISSSTSNALENGTVTTSKIEKRKPPTPEYTPIFQAIEPVKRSGSLKTSGITPDDLNIRLVGKAARQSLPGSMFKRKVEGLVDIFEAQGLLAQRLRPELPRVHSLVSLQRQSRRRSAKLTSPILTAYGKNYGSSEIGFLTTPHTPSTSPQLGPKRVPTPGSETMFTCSLSDAETEDSFVFGEKLERFTIHKDPVMRSTCSTAERLR